MIDKPTSPPSRLVREGPSNPLTVLLGSVAAVLVIGLVALAVWSYGYDCALRDMEARPCNQTQILDRQ